MKSHIPSSNFNTPSSGLVIKKSCPMDDADGNNNGGDDGGGDDDRIIANNC